MLEKYSRYRVLQEFFIYPTKEFHIRELSRRLHLAQPSVHNHVQALVKDGLLAKTTTGIYPAFKANRGSELFKMLKQQNLVLRMHSSGMIALIEESVRPGCIILFGSASHGEDKEGSDIDIFVQAKEASLGLGRYEKLYNRKIHAFFEPKTESLSKELRNNLANGIVLAGYYTPLP